MKLADHVEQIRQKIEKSFRNRLGRMGINSSSLQPVNDITAVYHEDRKRFENIFAVLKEETRSENEAYEKLVEEFTFTLFNRLAALKVMDAHTLHPEIVTRRSQHGDRSFAHFLWLEENPDGRNMEQEGLISFLETQLSTLTAEIPLFSLQHPYHLLPTAIELNDIINSFNQVEKDPQVDSDIWQSDDVLGWLYESYNNYKKAAHKASGEKTEFDKVSIQSQVYTPRWVVKFLVDNSLGKLYLEMYPDSSIKENYKIANTPKSQTRERKPLTEIRLIDPATGSGNFLLYAFDLFHDLYLDQIENYGADYNERKIPELIIHHNIHGIDLDDRAIQLAQLGLYIKAKRRKRSTKVEHFNIVSSDFYLPDYEEVKHLFENGVKLDAEQEKIVIDLWSDLQQAYKFGSLIRLDEKFNALFQKIVDQFNKPQGQLFEEETLANFDVFRDNFFANLNRALINNVKRQGVTFSNTKTKDAITFLQLLTQKYDVAVANPPYTDSSDFGLILRTFINTNYKKSYNFTSNLYATFIGRCYDVTSNDGYIAMIHPYTFMYIKSFRDVRKIMIEKCKIEWLADFGLDRVNLFEGGYASAPIFYVLSKKFKASSLSVFFKLNDSLQEKDKKRTFEIAFQDCLNNKPNNRCYLLNQSKLRIIEGWPLIYWISDGFRAKFREKSFEDCFDIVQGLATANNERFIRFWWEVDKDFLITKKNNNKWFDYSKGGPYNKWYGNNWTVVNWENNGYEIKKFVDDKGKQRSRPQNEKYYKKSGVTYTSVGTKPSFRLHPENYLFDVGGSCIFPTSDFNNIYYFLGLLNSKLVSYILECLNPTVNTNQGDIKRIPFVKPPNAIETSVSLMVRHNIELKKELYSFSILEKEFKDSPLSIDKNTSIIDRLLGYLNYENLHNTLILLNEAVINQHIYEVYDLSIEDKIQVESKKGKPIGSLPLQPEAATMFLSEVSTENIKLRNIVQNLEQVNFEDQFIVSIIGKLLLLYQSNNDLEAFCIRYQLNPINVWYWFRENKVLPKSRATEIVLEYLTDAVRAVLMGDEDGMVPLVGLPGEPRLLDRLEQHCYIQGFTTAQFMQLEGLLEWSINEYIEHHLFKDLSNHLNLFMYLPKTPFIWHLSSGEHQGFEAYIIIYKWNSDSLYKLKTKYLKKRAESLEYRLIELADVNTAQAQNEKEKIRLQLQEIAEFTRKVDELIAEGYDPKLDSGVGKNIAPLQKKGMLRCDVLNNKQLEKYLKADW